MLSSELPAVYISFGDDRVEWGPSAIYLSRKAHAWATCTSMICSPMITVLSKFSPFAGQKKKSCMCMQCFQCFKCS